MIGRISVTGLGYVGLPVATTFARAGMPVVSFDIDARRIAELSKGQDRTGEVEPDRLNHPEPALHRQPVSPYPDEHLAAGLHPSRRRPG